MTAAIIQDLHIALSLYYSQQIHNDFQYKRKPLSHPSTQKILISLSLSLSQLFSMTRVLVFALLISLSISCSNGTNDTCSPSSCGNIRNISYPFRQKNDPQHCGHPQYEVECENNQTVLHLNVTFKKSLLKLYVREISYERQQIQVIDPGLQQNDCATRQKSWLTRGAFDYGELYLLPRAYINNIVILRCPFQVDRPSYVAGSVCRKNTTYQEYMYAVTSVMRVSDVQPYCELVATSPSEKILRNRSYIEIQHHLLMGLNLSWKEPLSCRDCYDIGDECADYYQAMYGSNYFSHIHCIHSSYCRSNSQSLNCFFERTGLYWIDGLQKAAWAVLLRVAIGMLGVAMFLLYKLRTKDRWMDSTVEDFLSIYRCEAPTRYSYSDIKRMTSGFKEKLGQGGYGSVFKGKLRSGRFVAVKMLSNAKGNGQEFINEVATIGRIHHINVVQLVGFCSEGSKRGLIYDFMPNGSLEKFIFSQEESKFLSWDEIYKIALGIGRGIEYLHRGCDMRILHFDIKPHNILLDENFIPKVSDFGLAKFYPTDESIVSVTAARGTIGYMAPELFYKNIGKVSYKSDVYSYGMLLMEMGGRRKNLNVVAENSSQIYFPQWAYDQIDQSGDLGMQEADEDASKMVKKLVTVALWCIQMRPVDRPSMDKVVKMLEGSGEVPNVPTKPFLSYMGSMSNDGNMIHDFTTSIETDMESINLDEASLM